MTIKRTLFALIAMMMLPALAAAQPTPPPVTPAAGTAVIAVAMLFDNGNVGDSVAVNITCSAGSINPTSASLGNGEGQSFVLSNIPDGVTTTCEVTQNAFAGYDSSYLCAPGSGGAPDEGDVGAITSCSNPDFDVNVATSCTFNDVQAYQGDGVDPENVGYCIIVNEVAPVNFVVNKEWDISNAGAAGDDYTQAAAITITCNAEMMPGTQVPDSNNWAYNTTKFGPGAVTVQVYPSYTGSTCSAAENNPDSAVEVSNGCSSALPVKVGQGNSCTITNTLFFEGIPTLNQYGLAIMALLMLGVGFVGFRRFV